MYSVLETVEQVLCSVRSTSVYYYLCLPYGCFFFSVRVLSVTQEGLRGRPTQVPKVTYVHTYSSVRDLTRQECPVWAMRVYSSVRSITRYRMCFLLYACGGGYGTEHSVGEF